MLPNCLICMGGQETESIDTVKNFLPYALECNIDYFAQTMHNLSEDLPEFFQYTFVFTRSVTELPERFLDVPNVVVFVMGDEWARVPTYAHQVHAVFKAPGQDMKLMYPLPAVLTTEKYWVVCLKPARCCPVNAW